MGWSSACVKFGSKGRKHICGNQFAGAALSKCFLVEGKKNWNGSCSSTKDWIL